jgi:glycosyltransferase involved in cell wall biosynthesis
MGISLCMIVKNEENFLERCINSVKDFVDEIIIVDTGSTDKTKEIARKFTDKIYDFEWNNDFSKARNFSLSKATKDWIFVLDADEIVDKENIQKIKEEIDTNKAQAILITQRDYTKKQMAFGLTLLKEKTEYTKDYEGYVPMPIIRIFKRRKEIFYEGKVHETVGNSILLSKLKVSKRPDIFIHHYKDEKGEDKKKERQLTYLQIAEETIKKNPEDARAHYTISAVSEIYLGDHEKSLKHIKLAYKYGFDPETCLIGMGASLFNLKRYDEARLVFEEALSKKFMSPLIFSYLGKIFYLKKDYDKAKEMLKIFIQSNHPEKREAIKLLNYIETNIIKQDDISYEFNFGID